MKLSKILALGLMIFVLPVTAAAVAFAQDDTPEKESRVGLILAERAGVPYEQIAAYHRAGYGWGSIWRGLRYSELTRISLEEALAQAREVGLGKLYLDADLHPGMRGLGLGSLMRKGLVHNAGSDGVGPPAWAGPKDKGKGKSGDD